MRNCSQIAECTNIRAAYGHAHTYTHKNKETLVSPRENKELLPWRGESLLKPLNWSYLQVSVKVPRCCFFKALCQKSGVSATLHTTTSQSMNGGTGGGISAVPGVNHPLFPAPPPSPKQRWVFRGLHASHRSSCRRGAYGGLNRLDVASPLITVR